jgi:hypothetical protein
MPRPGLVREVLEEERIHGVLETDVQVRDLALGQRVDLHAGERHALEDAGFTSRGLRWVIDIDIENYLGSISHAHCTTFSTDESRIASRGR